MEWLIEPFELAFQQRAMLGGGLAAVCCSVVGAWVVIRGMSFLGDALVHGVIPGIVPRRPPRLQRVRGRRTGGGGDDRRDQPGASTDGFLGGHRIGLLFVGMLGLGVIFISRTPSYGGSLAAILFGDTLGVTYSDIAVLAAVTAVVTARLDPVLPGFPDPVLQRPEGPPPGLPPRFHQRRPAGTHHPGDRGFVPHGGHPAGVGLLVGPPATAALLVRRVPAIMAVGALIGVLVAWRVGLVISFHANTSGSATMAVVPIVLFFIVLGANSLRSGAERV